MSPAELTFAITAAANSIAEDISDDDRLELVAAVLTQLADTLSTIAAQRSMCPQSESSDE